MAETEDWVERSNREAAGLLAHEHRGFTMDEYNALVELLAAAYRQGALDGMKRAQEIIGTVTP